MNKAKYTNFGKTVMLPIEVWLNNKKLSEVKEWDEELYIDRPEDWYALMSNDLKYKRVRVVKSEDFKAAWSELLYENRKYDRTQMLKIKDLRTAMCALTEIPD